MSKRDTIKTRVPRNIDDLLKIKFPECSSQERWRRVWDFSALKADDWLGKPFLKKKHAKKK